MDREISAHERLKARRKLFIKFAAGAGAAVLAVTGIVLMMHGSVEASRLQMCEADRGQLDASISASGKVVPAFEQTITSPVDSRILEIYAKAGDTLLTGTPLLLLDLQNEERELRSLNDQRRIKELEIAKAKVNSHTHLSDIEMQVKVKEMTVNRLKAALENERRLDSIGSGTGEKVRQAELAYNTGELELEQLRKQLEGERQEAEAAMDVNRLDLSVFSSTIETKQRTLDDARLLSPRKAILTFIAEEIGSRVSAGEKLAVIADLDHFRIEGKIADSYVDRLTIGQQVIARIGKDRITGTVSNIQPSSSGGVVTFSVRLSDESNRRLRPGLGADLSVLTEVKEEVTRIRRGSYYSGPGNYELWVANAGGSEIELRKVKLGDANFDYVEVTEGIAPGEKVVTASFDHPAHASSLKLK